MYGGPWERGRPVDEEVRLGRDRKTTLYCEVSEKVEPEGHEGLNRTQV